MLKNLAPGDAVTVTRIDRSTFDLFAIVKQIVDAKAQFRSLSEPSADTGTSTGQLMIAVLGGLATMPVAPECLGVYLPLPRRETQPQQCLG
jgi:DNA invertase Pin-like site-specific DNA recombinase